MSASDVSAVTNHFSTASEGFTTTLASTASSGATTLALTSTSGLTNGKIFVGIIEPGTVGKEQTFTGVVDTGGNQITGVKWTRGSNTGHNAGVTIVDYVSGTGHNMMTKGLLVEHNQDGTHSDITATTADFTGAVSANTISEHTAASGVTVDGLLIKDNYVVGSATSGIKNESLGTAATDLGSAWQTGTPAATGFSSKTDDTLLYKQVGKTVFCNFKIEGTSNATTLTFTLPVAAKNTTSFGGIRTANSGAFSVNPGLLTFAASSATATGNRDHSGAAFTNTGTKGMQGFFFYEAA